MVMREKDGTLMWGAGVVVQGFSVWTLSFGELGTKAKW